MIQLNNVSKHFDGQKALNSVNLQINKGSIFGLLGSNGAGKTTLLKLLAGIYKQHSGEVLINDEQVFENERLKQNIIFIPDVVYFFSHYSILQMAKYYKSIYHSWNEERFKELQRIFGLDPRNKIHRFSKGMQRQVAFWLALSTMPDVLILDEPLDGLDPVMRKRIKDLLIQDVAEREMTVLISSHNLQEVEGICDQIGILHEGQLIMQKEIDAIKSDVHKIQIAFSNNIPMDLFNEVDMLFKEERGSVIICIVRGHEQDIRTSFLRYQPVIFDVLPLTLEEIFIYEMGDVGYAIDDILV
ncbi:ABC transporter ATP-binding protein [Cytobacillus sp. IB215316]|uniref:ABC transporter ATP-binding protein n=1 Tax=Cytobacillus sp. IB215316 TaxID=3097354 RepID=UPI002A0B0654|nr:ABC transporter ATP-binding protein [Cytobacillus sp. IB215316]MDX8360519.1 ABC transporter ATP-binding protein [Cytobacillus sp. IB215316]